MSFIVFMVTVDPEQLHTVHEHVCVCVCVFVCASMCVWVCVCVHTCACRRGLWDSECLNIASVQSVFSMCPCRERERWSRERGNVQRHLLKDVVIRVASRCNFWRCRPGVKKETSSRRWPRLAERILLSGALACTKRDSNRMQANSLMHHISPYQRAVISSFVPFLFPRSFDLSFCQIYENTAALEAHLRSAQHSAC